MGKKNEGTEINLKYWKNIKRSRILEATEVPTDEFLSRVKKNSRVLDLGTGNGRLAQFLFNKGYDVYAIDINQEAITANKDRYTSINYTVGNVLDTLPYKDAFFDAVVFSCVLVSVIEQELRSKLINEVTRILKPGGYVWFHEALVSSDYEHRYSMVKDIPGCEGYCFYSFDRGDLTINLEDSSSVNYAIKNEPYRIVRHYTEDELSLLFAHFNPVVKRFSQMRSPNSGMVMNNLTCLFQKPTNI